jgi:endonuclease/exonuclease/phosphatase family metal-dependent hydrolase
MTGLPALLRVATYNVHDCIGRDRRFDPARIAGILADLDADLIALQEVTQDSAGDLLRHFERVTGLSAIDGSLFERGVGRYGNLVLTRLPTLRTRLHDLSYGDREPRGLVEALLEHDADRLTVFATHLGFRRGERAEQLASLVRKIEPVRGAAVLLGDLNTWFGARTLAPLTALGFRHRRVNSFPTWPAPVAALDRILARPPMSVARCWRYESASAAVASDHFPVVAELQLRQSAIGGGPSPP